MAYYAYKTVRDLLPEHIIKQMGEDYEGDGNYDGDQWYAAEAYILELIEQRDAAQADAARYRWLRDMDEHPEYSLAAIFTDCQGSAESISQRIDYAVDTLMRMPK